LVSTTLYNSRSEVMLMSEKIIKIMQLVDDLSAEEFEELVTMIDSKAEALGILKIASSWWDDKEDAVYDNV